MLINLYTQKKNLNETKIIKPLKKINKLKTYKFLDY